MIILSNATCIEIEHQSSYCTSFLEYRYFKVILFHLHWNCVIVLTSIPAKRCSVQTIHRPFYPLNRPSTLSYVSKTDSFGCPRNVSQSLDMSDLCILVSRTILYPNEVQSMPAPISFDHNATYSPILDPMCTVAFRSAQILYDKYTTVSIEHHALSVPVLWERQTFKIDFHFVYLWILVMLHHCPNADNKHN